MAEQSAEPKTVLVLRTCNGDATSYNGFVWPKEGPVKCADWDPEPRCGGGLHGLLWGVGDGALLSWEDSALWLVVRVALADVVSIGDDKVKFSSGIVEHCGSQESATQYIFENGAAGKAVVGLSVTSGYKGQSTSGHKGQSTSGDYGQSTSGDKGQSTSGHKGQSTSGDKGILVLSWWDGTHVRRRTEIAYVGENGIKANVPYRLNDAHEFEEVDSDD